MFETPDLIHNQQEQGFLELTCGKTGDWYLDLVPTCVPVNCTDEPLRPPTTSAKGVYDWQWTPGK